MNNGNIVAAFTPTGGSAGVNADGSETPVVVFGHSEVLTHLWSSKTLFPAPVDSLLSFG